MRPTVRPPFVFSLTSTALLPASVGLAPARGDEVIEAARDAGSSEDTGAETSDGGAPSDASFPARCMLPPESGSCLAYIPRWAFDPARGACARFVWGGCGGNENNFERPTDCLDICLGTADAGTPRESACKVGDVVYPSGASGIPTPYGGCNTCTCLDGELGCTKIGCPSECPPNSVLDTGCAQCGPTDSCQVVEHGCFTVCSDAASCVSSGHGQCLGGVCKDVCG